MERILEVEPELPEPDAWATKEAIRSSSGASALSDLVDQFLASGGMVQEIEYGKATVDDCWFPHSGAPSNLAAARKRGTKVSIAARRPAK